MTLMASLLFVQKITHTEAIGQQKVANLILECLTLPVVALSVNALI